MVKLVTSITTNFTTATSRIGFAPINLKLLPVGSLQILSIPFRVSVSLIIAMTPCREVMTFALTLQRNLTHTMRISIRLCVYLPRKHISIVACPQEESNLSSQWHEFYRLSGFPERVTDLKNRWSRRDLEASAPALQTDMYCLPQRRGVITVQVLIRLSWS